MTGVTTADDFRVAVLLAPAMAVGFLLSSRIKHLAEGDRLRRGIMAVSAVAAIGLIVASLG